MKFKTHDQTTVNIDGTFLQGHITCDYKTLTKVFGFPLQRGFDNYKTDAEWRVKFEDGTVASIYNWKNGHNYLGTAGTPVTKITDWNVGGRDKHTVDRVQSAIKEYQDAESFAQVG